MYKKWRAAVALLGLFQREDTPPPTAESPEQPPDASDLTISAELREISKTDDFTVFDSSHTEEARKIIEQLLDAPSMLEFIAMCRKLRAAVNEEIYLYCLCVASYHRKDTKHFRLPPIYETHAKDFFRSGVLREALGDDLDSDELAEVPTIESVAMEIHPGTDTGLHVASGEGETPGSPTDDAVDAPEPIPEVIDEEKLDYFREDICLNSHHWHWHLVYPDSEIRGVYLDRRGELFYYMHRQMIARYDAERLSNGMPPVIAFDKWTEEIAEGYDPDIARGRVRYPPRPPGMTLADDHVQQLNTLKDQISYNKSTDVNALGTEVERGVHNTGHRHIAALSAPAVMSYLRTAIRDPVFFRWHKYIDDLIGGYKDLLDPYPESALTWPEVTLQSVQVLNEAGSVSDSLRTYKRTRRINMSYSVDFRVRAPRGRQVRVTHLDHEEFSYRLQLTNNTATPQWATVRLFLVPKYDESGREYLVRDFNTKCIEMDRFTEEVPPGDHKVVRGSDESSVVIPWDQSFDVLYQNLGREPPSRQRTEQFCGCGWPEHLQIPRGNRAGLDFHLVVMVTDWDRDKVESSDTDPPPSPELTLVSDRRVEKSCKNAASYCGLRDNLYPDRQAMGFPFDRPLKSETLHEFLSGKNNMKSTQIRIIHEDRVINP